jgi:hypothetical protein
VTHDPLDENPLVAQCAAQPTERSPLTHPHLSAQLLSAHGGGEQHPGSTAHSLSRHAQCAFGHLSGAGAGAGGGWARAMGATLHSTSQAAQPHSATIVGFVPSRASVTLLGSVPLHRWQRTFPCDRQVGGWLGSFPRVRRGSATPESSRPQIIQKVEKAFL